MTSTRRIPGNVELGAGGEPEPLAVLLCTTGAGVGCGTEADGTSL